MNFVYYRVLKRGFHPSYLELVVFKDGTALAAQVYPGAVNG